MLTHCLDALSLSITACDGWRGQSERTFILYQIFWSQTNSGLNILHTVMFTKVPLTACTCVWETCVRVCLSHETTWVCVPPKVRQRVCTYLPNGYKVSSFCHDANTSRILLITCYVDCFAVRTHMLVYVKRSVSSMSPHMHHILLKVHIWTWCKSYMLRKRFSNDRREKKVLIAHGWMGWRLNVAAGWGDLGETLCRNGGRIRKQRIIKIT